VEELHYKVLNMLTSQDCRVTL